jgi:hypothetical protein
MVENVGAGAPNLKKSQKNPILNVYFWNNSHMYISLWT